MVDIDQWTGLLKGKLLDAFGNRLVFLGLQGSYRRGEAAPDSDIDIMMVLDELSVPDMQAYKSVLASMPQRERACGFLCARDDLMRWPKYELFSLLQETAPILGELAPLLPLVTRRDIEDSVRNETAALYHALCHSYLYGTPERMAQKLPGFVKSAVFPLKLLCYLETGAYSSTKAELSGQAEGDDAALLALSGMDFNGCPREKLDEAVSLLIRWCQGALRRAAAQ